MPILRALYRRLITRTGLLKGKGIPVDIAGRGFFELDPSVAFGKYETWGAGRNEGLGEWIEACTGKRAVFDIGAHIGLYSMPISRVIHKEGCIYAFEPGDKNHLVLTKHIEYNDINNVQAFQCFVGEKEDANVPFFEQKDRVDGMNSIVIKANPHLYTKSSKKQVCLDDFCQQRGVVPEVIKIDVEGAELGVLKGAKNILTTHHPVVFLSVHPARLELLGKSVEELQGVLAGFGYLATIQHGVSLWVLR